MADFLKFDRLPPHNKLKRDGYVQQIRFEGGVIPAVNFVSHQWTGNGHADPDGHHLKTMQECFRRVIAHEPIFKSAQDEAAYRKGFSSEAHGKAASTFFADAYKKEIGSTAFEDSVANGWVWMDWIVW